MTHLVPRRVPQVVYCRFFVAWLQHCFSEGRILELHRAHHVAMNGLMALRIIDEQNTRGGR